MTRLSSRQIKKYDAFADLNLRWPAWRFVVRPLRNADMLILPQAKTIALGDSLTERSMVAARGVAHLDLGHMDVEGWLTEEQFKRAAWLARVRMDAPDGWPARELAEVEGPATT